MSILTESAVDASMSSTYDMGFDQSDMETSSSHASTDESPPKDYWFGRKYFECIIAQEILQRSELHESVAYIDSRWEEAMHKFPYLQSIKALRTQDTESCFGVVDTDSEDGAYRRLMICIGATVRNGDRQEKASLLAVLRQHRAISDFTDPYRPPHDGAAAMNDIRKASYTVGQAMNDEPVPVTDLGRYATALKEHGDQRGFTPRYDVEELSRVPPLFKAKVHADGSVFVGLATSKKQARHKAAMKACSKMDIVA